MIKHEKIKEIIGIVFIIYGILSVVTTLGWLQLGNDVFNVLNPLVQPVSGYYQNQGNAQVNTMYLGWGFFFVVIGFITWRYAVTKEAKKQ